MRLRYIPAAITLVAGAITSISSIIKGDDVLESLIRILVVLLVFYVIGIIAREIIRYALTLESKTKTEGQEENPAAQSDQNKATQDMESNSSNEENELES